MIYDEIKLKNKQNFFTIQFYKNLTDKNDFENIF